MGASRRAGPAQLRALEGAADIVAVRLRARGGGPLLKRSGRGSCRITCEPGGGGEAVPSLRCMALGMGG